MTTPIVIDVSKYDRTIDWPAVFAARPDISGVIVRHLIGFEGDAFFNMNRVHLEELGKPWSPYFTIYPHFDLGMQLEYIHAVLHSINWKCEGYLIPPSPEFPAGVLNRFWIDCEVQTELSRESNASKMKAAIDIVEAHLSDTGPDGHSTANTLPGQARPGIYTSQSWWSAYVGLQPWAKQSKLWVSNPGSIVPRMPPGWDEYELFQYTWEGDLAGFPRRPKVDLSKPFVRISGTYRAKVIASVLNVRAGPGTSFPIVGSLRYGAIGTVYEERLGWAKISSTEEKWCSRMYLQVVP